MQWIILIGDEKLNLDKIKAIKHYDSLASYDVSSIKNRYCVEYGNNHIFYDYEDGIIEDYEADELKKIPFAKPHFIMMSYTSEEQLKRVLQQDNFPKKLYIDNGSGFIATIERYIEMGFPMKQ